MKPDWSLTDRTTWITILTLIAAVVSDVFHRSFAGYVPAAATLAAGLVIAGVAVAKHHYAAAVTTAVTATTAATAAVPSSSELHTLAQQIGNVLLVAGTALGAAPATATTSMANRIYTAPADPSGAPTGLQGSFPAPTPPPAATAPPAGP